MDEEILFSHPHIPVKETKELLLHEVDLSHAEAEMLVTPDGSVACPVLVLGRGVVKVLGRKDE